jgi:hypothetical protein
MVGLTNLRRALAKFWDRRRTRPFVHAYESQWAPSALPSADLVSERQQEDEYLERLKKLRKDGQRVEVLPGGPLGIG